MGEIHRAPGMCFCGEIEHARDVIFPQEAISQFAVVDIPFHEVEAGILIRSDQIPTISRMGQLVQDDEGFQPLHPQEVAGEGGADEAGSSGQEDGAELAHTGA